MNRRIIALTAVIVLAVSASLIAFSGGRGAHARGGEISRLNFMQNKCSLTDEQVKKIFDINTAFQNKLFKNGNDKDAVEAALNEKRTAIESVLTEDQKSRMQGRLNREGRMGRFDGMARFGNRLSLTDDQKTSMFNLRMEYRTKMFSVRKDSAVLETLRLEMHNKMTALLTDDQKAQLKDRRGNHRRDQRGCRGQGFRDM